MGTQRISEPADNKQASGYRSPPGTFEPVLKSILEDPALSDAEFRVALYLATKPEGWAAKPRQIARALNRPLSRIERALTGLRAKGLVTTAEERQNGVFTARTSRLNRALIVAPASKPPGQDQHAESAPWSPPADSPQTPRSEPARRFTTRGQSAPHREDGFLLAKKEENQVSLSEPVPVITDLAVRTDAVVERETKPSSLSITTHLLSEHGTELDAGTVRALLDSYGWADNPMAAIRRDVERGDIYAKIDKARAKAGLLAHMTADAQQEEQKRAEKAEHERLTAIRAEYVSQLTEEQRRLVCRWGRSAWSDLGGTCCEIAVVPYSMLNMDAGYCAAHAPEIERQRAEATAKVASGKTRREQVQAEFNRKLANFDGDLHEHLARPETG